MISKTPLLAYNITVGSKRLSRSSLKMLGKEWYNYV